MRKFQVGFLSIIILLVMTVVSCPKTTHAVQWQQTFYDDFNRSVGPIGNDWQDATTTRLSLITSPGVLNFQNATTNVSWYDGTVYRPFNEATTSQKVTATTYPNSTNSSLFLTLRKSGGWNAGNQYTFGVLNSNTLYISSLVSGVKNAPLSRVLDSTHLYRYEATAIGASSTQLTFKVIDATDNIMIGFATGTDARSSIQVPGVAGMYDWQSSINVKDFTTYAGLDATTTTYHISSQSWSGLVGSTTSIFVIPDGMYTGTITLSDNGGGGTFSSNTVTFNNSSTTQSVTYTPATVGQKLISATSNPVITDPVSFIYTVTSPAQGSIPVNDSNIVWSPYNWRFNGSSWAQSSPGGAYFKIAFTGNTLAVGVDTSINTGVPLSSIKLNAYIDGATSPIQKNLSQASNGVLTFSSTLSPGNHYAIVYFSQTSVNYNRWADPVVNSVRITKIQLVQDGTGVTRTLSTTPLAQKRLKTVHFGDSITEGYGDTAAEKSYAAIVGQTLGTEYGQVGYGCLGWNNNCQGGVPYFQETIATTSLWRRLDSVTSRLNNVNDPASGFVDGAPAAVFLDMGTNDAYSSKSTTSMRTKTTAFLNEIRQTIGQSPAVFVVSPFYLESSGKSTYKTALFDGVADYRSANPSDARIYTLDLGTSGYNTVVANSSDSLHPNDAGAAILGAQIAALSAPYIPIINAEVRTITKNSTASIPLSGTYTNWSSGAQNFTIVGGSGARIVSQIIHSGGSALLEIAAGSLSGTLYIVDNNTNASTTIQISDTQGSFSSGGGSNTVGGGSGYVSGTNRNNSTPAIPSNGPQVQGPSQGGSPVVFTTNIQVNTVHSDVKKLQQYLNAKGFIVAAKGGGSVGNETTYFGSATKAALIKFQKSVGIVPASGYFGPLTRAYIASH